jgi:hypothetical protein
MPRSRQVPTFRFLLDSLDADDVRLDGLQAAGERILARQVSWRDPDRQLSLLLGRDHALGDPLRLLAGVTRYEREQLHDPAKLTAVRQAFRERALQIKSRVDAVLFDLATLQPSGALVAMRQDAVVMEMNVDGILSAYLSQYGVDHTDVIERLVKVRQAVDRVAQEFTRPAARPPNRRRAQLAFGTAWLLRGADVPVKKHASSLYARVLAVVLEASGERVPEDLSDVVSSAVDALRSPAAAAHAAEVQQWIRTTALHVARVSPSANNLRMGE